MAFANDLDEPAALIAVSASSNRSKGADDPAEWLPPNRNDVCRYIAAWVIVKAKWDLSMDQTEADQVRWLLSGDCEGTTTPAATMWPSNPAPASTATTTIGLSCDPAYPTVCIPPPPPDLDCGDITYRNFTVL